MSYQVLARKWRPKNFEELVGQRHVMQALSNALENERLHHAYLFTGTRGVGKTTIARILSKCLNCDQGISSHPCGECHTCREIDEGRFVDLIEVDAASRTKVEQTRELLENVQYRPTRGRYKVYLIDEVHMLSNSSFNALLKTLEEPPPHVVFLLATTDPQKMPITVLSRCLQFHLKSMTEEQIEAHLAHVLDKESIVYDHESLQLLARSADGSMRDSLSLLDQAIAFGGGQLQVADVRAMLGTIDQHFIERLAFSLAGGGMDALLQTVDEMKDFSPDYDAALAELLSLFHRAALLQAVATPGSDSKEATLADMLAPEVLQLFYQLGLQARRDLSFAPSPRQGFEMGLLRMMAFRPQDMASSVPSQMSQSLKDRGASAASEPSSDYSIATKATETEAAEIQVETEATPTKATAEKKTPDFAAVVSENTELAGDTGQVNSKSHPTADTDFQPTQHRTDDFDSSENEPADASSDELPPPWEDLPDNLAEAEVADGAQGATAIDKAPAAATPSATTPLATSCPLQDSASVTQSASPSQESARLDSVSGLHVSDSAFEQEQAEDVTLAEAPQSLDVGSPQFAEATLAEQWQMVVENMQLNGLPQQLALNSAPEALEQDRLTLFCQEEFSSLISEASLQKLTEEVSRLWQRSLQVQLIPGQPSSETPRERKVRLQAEAKQRAQDYLQQHPTVRGLVAEFNATLDLDGVEPIIQT